MRSNADSCSSCAYAGDGCSLFASADGSNGGIAALPGKLIIISVLRFADSIYSDGTSRIYLCNSRIQAYSRKSYGFGLLRIKGNAVIPERRRSTGGRVIDSVYGFNRYCAAAFYRTAAAREYDGREPVIYILNSVILFRIISLLKPEAIDAVFVIRVIGSQCNPEILSKIGCGLARCLFECTRKGTSACHAFKQSPEG